MALPELLPFLLGELAPTHATIVLTGNTPVVTVSGPLTPSAAVITVTGGTPVLITAQLPVTLPWTLPGQWAFFPSPALISLTGGAVLLSPLTPAPALIYVSGLPVLCFIPGTGTVALPWNVVTVAAESRQVVIPPISRTVVA